MRKEGQKEYPGKTLYEMICCIQAYFRIECKRNITLVDNKGCYFRNLNSAFNFQMKQKASASISVDVKQTKVISENDKLFAGAWLLPPQGFGQNPRRHPRIPRVYTYKEFQNVIK